MKQKKIEKLKKELMEPGWTEELHQALIELGPSNAKKIVDSMTFDEIYSKVNLRNRQQDYIAEYLDFLWEISESAYWKHLIITLDLKIGFLWADDMLHFEKLCNTKIPEDVLEAVLDFAIGVEIKENYTQDFEIIACVVKAQAEKFDRIDDINKYISELSNDIQESAKSKITRMINCECQY
jgi:hypothetical protein